VLAPVTGPLKGLTGAVPVVSGLASGIK